MLSLSFCPFSGDGREEQPVRVRVAGPEVQAGQRVRAGVRGRVPEDAAALLPGQAARRDTAQGRKWVQTGKNTARRVNIRGAMTFLDQFKCYFRRFNRNF